MLISQKYNGATPEQTGYGNGDIGDMVLLAEAMENAHVGFLEAVKHVATENGELHALQELEEKK